MNWIRTKSLWDSTFLEGVASVGNIVGRMEGRAPVGCWSRFYDDFVEALQNEVEALLKAAFLTDAEARLSACLLKIVTLKFCKAGLGMVALQRSLR